ncbi:MAG TPA: hypothetical protein VFU15_14300, partial [Bacteroidia bacterium]|nr:hypothetical protein [Bacteroidia bacterium]
MIRLPVPKTLLPVMALVVLSFGKTAATEVLKTDTVPLDVNTAEQRLVSKSLMLLAARYDVDIAKS